MSSLQALQAAYPRNREVFSSSSTTSFIGTVPNSTCMQRSVRSMHSLHGAAVNHACCINSRS